MLKTFFSILIALFLFIHTALSQNTDLNADSVVKSIESMNIPDVEKAEKYNLFALNYRVSHAQLAIQC